MLSQMLDVIMSCCCLGKPEKKKLIDEMRDNLKHLTTQETMLLRTYMVGPLRDKSYCC